MPGEPRGVPTLERPITLDELHVWRDGGSLGFKLSDAKHHQLAFCVDGKIGSSTPGYFYSNVTHPDQNGGQKLDSGGAAEKTLLSYLESWLASNFTEEQRTAILQTKEVGKRTKLEFDAWHVVQLIENRSKVIHASRRTPKRVIPARSWLLDTKTPAGNEKAATIEGLCAARLGHLLGRSGGCYGARFASGGR